MEGLVYSNLHRFIKNSNGESNKLIAIYACHRTGIKEVCGEVVVFNQCFSITVMVFEHRVSRNST